MKYLRRFAVLSITVLWVSPVGALQNQSPPDAPAMLEGIVVNAENGKPLPGVVVAAQSESDPIATFATTNDDGRFRIDRLKPDEYYISASKKGFVPNTERTSPADSTLTDHVILEGGERRTNVRLKMEAGAAVSGRILDDKSRPRSSTIQLLKYEYQGEYRLLAPLVMAEVGTDDRGDYRVFHVKPGEYILRAAPGRRASVAQKLEAPVYFPGVIDPQQATPILLRSGADIGGIDIRVVGGASYSARFKVTGFVPGTANLLVEAVRRGNPMLKEGLRCASTGEDTRVCGGLVPGTYDIRVRSLSSLEENSRFGHLAVEVVDRDIDAPDLALYPLVHIQGRISIPPNLASRIAVKDLAIEAQMPPNVHAFFAPRTSAVAADGTFTIDAAEGTHPITVLNLPTDVFLESARYDSQDVTNNALTVQRSSNAQLELTLSGATGTVAGFVRTASGEPVAHSIVSLVPGSDRRQNFRAFRTSETDDSGAFRIEGVPAGDYSALAFKGIESGAETNRGFVERFETLAQRVTAESGKLKTLDLRLIPR